jgi:hypothetical protein
VDAEVRAHALAAFRLADATTDGKRDYTDAQAAVFINEELVNRS